MTRYLKFTLTDIFTKKLFSFFLSLFFPGKSICLINILAFFFRPFIKSRKKVFLGFTLAELMLIIGIMGTLSAISIPMYANYIEKARVIRAVAEIRTLEKEIAAYELEHLVLPNSLHDIGRGNLLDPWGNPYQYLNIAKILEDEDKKEKGKGKDKGNGNGNGGQDKEGMRKDRWEKPLNYDYDLYSMGKDGDTRASLRAKASHDDVVRASDGGFVGLASEYS